MFLLTRTTAVAKFCVLGWFLYAASAIPLDASLAIGYWVMFFVSVAGAGVALRIVLVGDRAPLLGIHLALACILATFHILVWAQTLLAVGDGTSAIVLTVVRAHFALVVSYIDRGMYWPALRQAIWEVMPFVLLAITLVLKLQGRSEKGPV